MSKQTDLFDPPPERGLPSAKDARDRRDEGIDRVSGKADRLHEGWKLEAFAYLESYVRRLRGVAFLSEEFAAWAQVEGLSAPHDGRAYGAVVQMGMRRGVIVQCGFRRARTSNLSPKVLWKGAP